MAVLSVCTLTAADSYSPYSFMSTTLPVSPSTPNWYSPAACLALVKEGDQHGAESEQKGRTHPQRRQHPDGVTTAVLHQCPRDNLHRLTDGPERPSLDTLDSPSLLRKSNRDGHLGSSSSRRETGIKDDVASDGHGIGEVSVDLVEDVLGRAAEEDGAGLGELALGEEGEVAGDKRGVLAPAERRAKNNTHSSPSLSTWKRPQLVPTSDSRRSSTRLMMVAPVARAIRLLSDLRTRRMAVMGGSALRR